MALTKPDPPCDYVRSEVNHFEDVSYDVSVDNTSISVYHPLHSIESRTAPVEFHVTGNDVHHINLAESRLYVRCRIVDKDDKPIPYEADKTKSAYAPVNNLLETMWESVQLYLNDFETVKFTKDYGLRSFIESTFGKGKVYQKSIAQAAGHFRSKDETDVTDPSWVERCNLVDKSQIFELIGRPHLDLIAQSRWIVPGMNVKIVFNRAQDSFCIHTAGTNAPTGLKLQLLEAQFIVTKHEVIKSVWMEQFKYWHAGHPLIYPMRDQHMRSYNIPTGTSSHSNESIIRGFLPDKLILGLCDSKNIHGSYDTTPLAFQDFGITNVIITYNSDVISNFNMEVDFANNRMIRAYSSVYENLGLADCDSGIDISMEEFKKSKTFFVFDFRHMRRGPSTPRHGSCNISLRFKNPTAKALSVMCFLDYQSVMYVHSDGRVQFKEYEKAH